MEQKIKGYILKLLSEKSIHQSSCMFPEEECSCKRLDTIKSDTSLLRGGYIDSFLVETIVVFLEAMFEIEVPDNEVKEENFDTIDKMVKLINTLK